MQVAYVAKQDPHAGERERQHKLRLVVRDARRGIHKKKLLHVSRMKDMTDLTAR